MTKRLKTLLLTGGIVHDWKGCGDEIERILREETQIDLTRVNDDLDCLTAENLEPFEIIVMYWTRREIADAQKNGLLNGIASGKGFVGIHGTTVSFVDTPEFAAMVGGSFIGHPRYRSYPVSIANPDHPIIKGLFPEEPAEFEAVDEMYVIDYDPRVNVLASALWKGKAMPVAWTRSWGKGKVYYLALGHDPEACRRTPFPQLLIRGTLWAGGLMNPDADIPLTGRG